MPIDEQGLIEPCLSEEQVVAFSEGTLTPVEIELLHAHLDHCAACLELVNATVHHRDGASAADAVDRIWMATFGAGQLIASRFRIERFIGRGGMGEVYLAHDGVLGEPVALKTLLSTISDNPHALDRLLIEARLARRVSHPNVCRVHDIGLHEERGRVDERLHFLTMEFIDGPRLGQLVRAGRLELSFVLAIARQILAGLAAAHAAGVLHRDLKSDNILLDHASRGQAASGQVVSEHVANEQVANGHGVAADDDGLRVVITDFGLAQALDGAGAASRGQERVGSVSYMAPEQILGQNLSFATDLFAFGVVMFEMLCGELPFTCDDGSREAALRRLVQKPVAPSQLRPDVPPALDRLVLRCLMEKPEDRFASAEEALLALDGAYAANRPSAIYPTSWGSASGLDEARGVAPVPRLDDTAPRLEDTVPRVNDLSWVNSGELVGGEVPLVSVAALFKA